MQAVNALLAPLAQLAVAKGMPCAMVEGLLRQAFVRAARDAHPNLPPHRMVSRIATATGLNRREVTRLTQTEVAPRAPASAVRRSVCTLGQRPAVPGCAAAAHASCRARAQRPASRRWRIR